MLQCCLEGPCCSGDEDKSVRSRRAHGVWCLQQGSSSAAPGSGTCALLQKGLRAAPAAAAWLGRNSSGIELGHELLPSLPNEAVAWVSYIHPLVSKPTQKINGSVFIWGGLVLHWTQAEDNGRYPQWLHTDFLWGPCNEAIYSAQGWALSPISDWNPWMEHSWPPHQASHSHSTDVALRGGHSKVAASGFVAEVLAIGFFPSSV